MFGGKLNRPELRQPEHDDLSESAYAARLYKITENSQERSLLSLAPKCCVLLNASLITVFLAVTVCL